MSDQGRRLQEGPPARHSSALRVRAKVLVSLLGQGQWGSRSCLQLQQRVGHVWNPVDRENAASHVTDVGTQHVRSEWLAVRDGSSIRGSLFRGARARAGVP